MNKKEYPIRFESANQRLICHVDSQETKKSLEKELIKFCQAYDIVFIGGGSADVYCKGVIKPYCIHKDLVGKLNVKIDGQEILEIHSQDELSAQMNFGGYSKEKATTSQIGPNGVSLDFGNAHYFIRFEKEKEVQQ